MLALLVLGCTFAPGAEGFTTLAGASLSAALSEEDPAAFFTAEGHLVELDAATLNLGDLTLLELGGGAGADFDPAAPPAGYSLCHGGHCHSDSGDLVDYADIILELSGGAATFTAIAAFEGPFALDLLTGERLTLPEAAPSPHLPISEISLVESTWDGEAPGLSLGGWITPAGEDEPRPLSVSLSPAQTLSGGVDLSVSRSQEPAVTLELSLALSGLLDGLPEAALEGSEVFIEDPEDPGAVELTENLIATELASDVDPADAP